MRHRILSTSALATLYGVILGIIIGALLCYAGTPANAEGYGPSTWYGGVDSTPHRYYHPHGWNTYPPCEQEDGPGPCVWDAQHMGNGEGRSFVLNGRHVVDEDHPVKFIPESRAHVLLGWMF